MVRGLILACGLALAALGGALPQAAVAQAAPLSKDPQIGRADALLAAYTRERPGVAVLVARGGKVVFERYRGAADLEHDQPVGPQTRFHVASVSKQFTAFAVAELARQGKLDLSADIRTYLPEMPDYGRRITVADLLHHTSGLRDQWGLFVLSGADFQDHLKQRSILAMARRQAALNFDPGTEYEYSNTGYSLAATIVERVSGTSFRKFLAEHAFEPLGMAETLVYDDASELVPHRAMSYGVGPGGKVRLVRLNYHNYGATSLHTTARDLTTWARELLHPKVLDAGVLGAMRAPGKLRDGSSIPYGLGLVNMTVAGRRAIGHGGSDAGYRSYLVIFPEADASIVVLSNGQADVGELATRMADIFLNDGDGGPPSWPSLPASAEAMQKYLGVYVSERAPSMELALDNGELVRISATAGQGRAKFMESGSFYLDRPENAFSLAANGRDLEFRSVNGGPPVVWRRVERVQPTAPEMQALAGAYRSDELDITYNLAVENGRLQLSSLHADPVILTPSAKDMFDAPGFYGSVVRVERDRAGRPQRLLLTLMGGRVRNLALERVR